MDCKKCGNDINLQVFGIPEDICFGCYDGDYIEENISTPIKAKTQPMGCPCCESPAKIVTNVFLGEKTSVKLYKICCSKCSIQTANLKTEDEAIAEWNTRPNHNKMFRTFAV